MNQNKNNLESQNILVEEDGQPSEDTKNMAKIIKARLEDSKQQRRKILQEVKINISYLLGYQNIGLQGNSIVELPAESRTASVTNIIMPAVTSDIAKATRTPPMFDIVPSGTDDDDRATALLCDKILPYLQRINGKDIKRSDAVMWYDIIGVGWRKVYWDPNHAVKGINPPAQLEDGQPNPAHNPNMEEGEPIMEGEVIVESVPVTELIYDFRASDLSSLDWIIHAKRVPLAAIYDKFGAAAGEKLKSKAGQANSDGESEFEINIMTAFHSQMGTNSQSTSIPSDNRALDSSMRLDSDKFIDYYEYWHKPTKAMPTGAYAIMVADQLLHHEPFPTGMYPHNDLPFVPADPMSFAGIITGAASRISQARPIQRKYNRVESFINDNISIMGNSIYMAPKSSKLNMKRMSNGAGVMIEYEGIGKPTRESGVPMPNDAFGYLSTIKHQSDELFAFHEPSRGMAPSGIKSGTAIARLQQADYSQLGPIVTGFEKADERVVYQMLMLAVGNYQDRLINIGGTDQEWTLQAIDKDQLKGKINVIVKRGSSMPVDQEKEAQYAFQVWQSGLIGNPNDPDNRLWTLRQMDLGNADGLLQKNNKQINFAQKEYYMAEKNLKEMPAIPQNISEEQLAVLVQQFTFVPNVNMFDDHAVHIQMHGEFLIDKIWEYRKTGNHLYLELLNNMQLHIIQHQQIVQQQQQAQQQQQLMAQAFLRGNTMDQIALKKMNFTEDKKSTPADK